ncbi:MAG: tyrosine-type recombinase/integrase [Bacteroidota bacterium]|nr:tyrosine-type recombinase/integrase [Bacteroidota bacterium]
MTKTIRQLIEEKAFAASSVNQTFNALRFLYVDLYTMPFAIGAVPRPRKEKHLPIVLDKEEVVRIFDAVENLKHKPMLMLIYSAGLRVGEAVKLRVEDIDSKRKLIYIRSAKGFQRSKIRLIVCDYMRKRIYNTNKRSSSIIPKVGIYTKFINTLVSGHCNGHKHDN